MVPTGAPASPTEINRPPSIAIRVAASSPARRVVSVIRDTLVSNAPVSGRPGETTTWRFAGFPVAGTAIYGHFRFHGRTIRNHRFGVPTGPCGALTVRARRVPIPAPRLRSGTWTLQLDQRRHYQPTGRHRVFRFRIFRTLL